MQRPLLCLSFSRWGNQGSERSTSHGNICRGVDSTRTYIKVKRTLDHRTTYCTTAKPFILCCHVWECHLSITLYHASAQAAYYRKIWRVRLYIYIYICVYLTLLLARCKYKSLFNMDLFLAVTANLIKLITVCSHAWAEYLTPTISCNEQSCLETCPEKHIQHNSDRSWKFTVDG